MSVKIIDTLKPKNNGSFPIVEAVDVSVSEDLRLPEALEAKADASALASTNEEVATKANASDVATATANLQGQINQIEISATAEAVVAPEVAAARVDADGTSFTTLKERIDNNQTSTGAKLEKKLDTYEEYVDQEITVNEGNMIDVTNGNLYPTAGTESISFDVEEGEKYIVTGWHFNSTYCGLSLTPGTIRQTSVEGSFEKEVTIPSGVTKMRINGKTSGSGKITIKKVVSETSEHFWERFNSDEQAISGKLDGYEKFIPKSITVTEGKMIDVTNGTEYASEGTESIEYTVSSGEQYIVTGWHFNNTYCGLSLSPGTIRQTSSVGKFEKEVTIPEGVTKMRINGRTDGKITIKKLESVPSSEFWDEYKVIKKSVETSVKYRDRCGVRVVEGGVVVYLDRYDSQADLRFSIMKKSGNGLPDFQSIATVANTSDNVSVTDEEYPDYIFSSATDFLSPSCVYAVDNIDGDFPSLEVQKLTGGWHMYNNNTSGEYSPTARNISFTVYCDGKEVEEGETARGSEIVIDIVNRLQGSNTEKSDGTGREIVEQHFRIKFGDGFKAQVRGEITALEDVKYSLYYGISTINITGTPVRFIGSRTNRHENAYDSVTRCGDKHCTGTQQVTASDIYEMHINPSTDLGTMYANRWENSCTMSSGKSYMVLIYGLTENDMLSLSEGDKVFWEGYFQINKRS